MKKNQRILISLEDRKKNWIKNCIQKDSMISKSSKIDDFAKICKN